MLSINQLIIWSPTVPPSQYDSAESQWTVILNYHPALLNSICRVYYQVLHKGSKKCTVGRVTRMTFTVLSSHTQLWPLSQKVRAFLGFLGAHSPPCLLVHQGLPKEQFQDQFNNKINAINRKARENTAGLSPWHPAFHWYQKVPDGRGHVLCIFGLCGFGAWITLTGGTRECFMNN